jgi:hypothetical protein
VEDKNKKRIDGNNHIIFDLLIYEKTKIMRINQGGKY